VTRRFDKNPRRFDKKYIEDLRRKYHNLVKEFSREMSKNKQKKRAFNPL